MAIEQAIGLGSEYFNDPNIGRPVFNGSVYIGKVDLDPKNIADRITVTVIEEDGTRVTILPAAQPLLTGTGGTIIYNGKPVSVVTDLDYSIRVDDSQGAQVYYFPFVQNNALALILITKAQQDTVAVMVADTAMTVGLTVETKSYYAWQSPVNEAPKGGANYNIVSAADYTLITGNAFPDELGDHTLSNGNVAMISILEDILVDQFGAIPDGVSDSSASITSAVLMAENKKIPLVLGGGTYLGWISATSTITIRGQGKGVTTLKNNSANLPCVSFSGASQLSQITDISIDNNFKVSNSIESIGSVYYMYIDNIYIYNCGNETQIKYAVYLDGATITSLSNIWILDITNTYGGHLFMTTSYYSNITNFTMGTGGSHQSQFSVRCNAVEGGNWRGLYCEEGAGNGAMLFTSCRGITIQGLSCEFFSTRNPPLTSSGWIAFSVCSNMAIIGGYISHQAATGATIPMIHFSQCSGVEVSGMYLNRSINQDVPFIKTNLGSSIKIENIGIRNVVAIGDSTPVPCLAIDCNDGDGVIVKNITENSTGISCDFDSCTGLVVQNVPNPTFVNANVAPLSNGLNPAFTASAVLQSNITGDGSGYTVLFDVTRFDNLNNYTSPNFVAPVTGRYLVSTAVALSGILDTHTYGLLRIVTTSKSYDMDVKDVAAIRTKSIAPDYVTLNGTMLVDMAAGEECSILIGIQNGTKVINVTIDSYFSVFLIK